MSSASRRANPCTSLRAAGAVLIGYGALQWIGRTYGSTWAERHTPMPGDDLVRGPQVSVTHAITVPAEPSRVWPWLVQMGWGRAGWYTPHWVDAALFPANAPSADRILPEHQSLAVGDEIPDGPPETECAFTVVELVEERCLVLRSTSHLPLVWRQRGAAGVDWTWAFTLRRTPGGARLVFRWRALTAPLWLTVLAQLVVVPADAVMSRGMLRGLRERVLADLDGPRCGNKVPSPGDGGPCVVRRVRDSMKTGS